VWVGPSRSGCMKKRIEKERTAQAEKEKEPPAEEM
jgi:hypothetical protein